MNTVRRRSEGTGYSLCVQPAFIIGTNNEDGTPNFAPITWVSAACAGGNDYLLVISMFGGKTTKQNVMRTGRLSANLVSTDMLPLMDYFGTHHARDGKKDALPYAVSRGKKVDVPVLDASRWVYECEVEQSVQTGESTTFFCRIRNVQIDESVSCRDTFDVDLTRLDPVIYSGMYHSIGKLLGRIGDFAGDGRTGEHGA
ncbi:MAG: flavin reductase family protein [Clostridia bacterium]|nr:flavin reductase family protein [Clostridia bacterium]